MSETMAETESVEIKIEIDHEERNENEDNNGVFQRNEEAEISVPAPVSSEMLLVEIPVIVKTENAAENVHSNTLPVSTEDYCEPPITKKQSNSQWWNKFTHLRKCIVCGSQIKTSEFPREKWLETEKWREDCAETLCDLFLNSESHHFDDYFHIAYYCSMCQKLIWDADFTRRQILSLQNNIKLLSIALRKRFAQNFNRLKKLKQRRSKKGLCSPPSTTTNDDFIENVSYDEIVEMIHKENAANFNLNSINTEEKWLRRVTKPRNYIITTSNALNIPSKPQKKNLKKNTPKTNKNIKKNTPQTNKNVSKNKSGHSRQKDKVSELFSTATEMTSDSKLTANTEKPGRSKKTDISIAGQNIKHEEKKVLESTTTVITAAEEDSNMSNDNWELGEPEIDPEPPTEVSLEDDNLNSEGRSRRRRKPVKRLMIENVRFISYNLQSGLFEGSDEDSPEEEPVKKRKKKKDTDELISEQPLDEASQQQQPPKKKKQQKKKKGSDDESDYVPEEGNNKTSHEVRWDRKKKERFRRMHPNPNFPCTVPGCNATYTRKNVLNHHIKTVHEGIKDTYYCEFCPQTFHLKSELRRHTVRHPESNITVDDPDYIKPIYEFTCAICGQVYHTEEELTTHSDIHTGPNPFNCCHCNKKFTNSTDLKLHVRSEHDKETPTCEFCGKTFQSTRTLQKHRKLHLNPDECFKCEECPFVGVTFESLRNHIQNRHMEGDSVQCETCGKTLKSAKLLRTHMKTVHDTERKRYKCSLCEKVFATYGGLKRHEEVHSGMGRTHVCSFCGKSLSHASNLAAHELIHTRDPNVPLPKRIYKKPFPKKKPKVKQPAVAEVDTTSHSSQSQDSEPPLNLASSSNALFSSGPNEFQNTLFNTSGGIYNNLPRQQYPQNFPQFSQSQMLQGQNPNAANNTFPFPSATFPFIYNMQNGPQQ